MKKLIPILLLIVLIVSTQKRDICGIAYKRLNDIHTDWSHNKFYRMNLFRYCPRCYWFGENLGRGQSSIEEVYRQWSKSPSHKANLDKKWRSRCFVNDNYQGVNYYVEIYAN